MQRGARYPVYTCLNSVKYNGFSKFFSDKYIDFHQNLAEYRVAELILNQAILDQKNSWQLCCGALHF
jgi:hypothetical protein